MLDMQYRTKTIWGDCATFASERRWLVLFVLCIAVFLVVVDNTIVNVALPDLARPARGQIRSSQWIVDGYSLRSPDFYSPAGALGTVWAAARHADRTVFFAFFGVSLLAAFSHNVQPSLRHRALMGASAAFIFPATLSTCGRHR